MLAVYFAFLSRAVLGLGLWAISEYHLPFLQSLQLGDGFWLFAPDAPGFPRPVPIPLILVGNAVLMAACVWMARELAGEAGGLAGWLVALWPSSFAWSSQYLKDAVAWAAIFAVLLGLKLVLSRVSLSLAIVQMGATALAVWRPFLLAPMLGALGIGAAATALLWRRHVVAMGAALLVVATTTFISGNYMERIFGLPPGSPAAAAAATAAAAPAAQVAVAAEICRPVHFLLVERTAFIATGGTQDDPNWQFHSCLDVATYVPKALERAFLKPLPWEWAQPGSTTGPLRYLAGADALFSWLVIAGLLLQARQRPSLMTIIIVAFAIPVAIAFGLTEANWGTLFRHRLMWLLPLAVVAAQGLHMRAHVRAPLMILRRIRPWPIAA